MTDGVTPDEVVVRIRIPMHLRNIANLDGEAELPVTGTVSQASVLDALEEAYPPLRGTIRDQQTKERRAFIRFFVCGQDWSHEPVDAPLPDAVVRGQEPFIVVGALAGG